MAHQQAIPLKQLQWLQGQLMHASYGIPNGKALLSPIMALATKHSTKQCANIPLNAATKQALWANPTLCTDLLPSAPDYIGYCDASKHGAGGICIGGRKQLPAIVWWITFPASTQENICSKINPAGTITNLDLEMAGLLGPWLVLECLVDLQHNHMAIGCDNTPTVAWAS